MDKNKPGINVLWAILCENASVDQQTNTLSIFKVIEEITVSAAPISNDEIKAGVETTDFETKTQINSKHVLVAQIERDSDLNSNVQTQMKLEVFDPTGESLLKNEFPLEFGSAKNATRTRAIVNFDGMLVTKTGRYIYRLSTKVAGDKVFTKKFEVPVEIRIAK